MKFIQRNSMKLVLRKQFYNKIFKLVDLAWFSHPLLASNQTIHPLIILLFVFLVVLHLIPNSLKGTYQNFDLVAQFIDETKKTQHLRYNIFCHCVFVVSYGFDHHLIYILLC